MGMKLEIEAALMAHSAWRKHFRDYLNGKASFDVSTAGASDQCDFGKWLNQEGRRLISPKRHGEICSAHDEFHQVAAGILQKIKEKRFTEVRAEIAAEGLLNRASARLSEELLKAALHENVATVVPPPNEAAPVSQGIEKPPE
jgi:hypothetical protein